MENNQTITVADLEAIKRIIDLASTRGAFRGSELAQVGAVYDKLAAFLEVIVAQAAAQEAEAQAAESSKSLGE